MLVKQTDRLLTEGGVHKLVSRTLGWSYAHPELAAAKPEDLGLWISLDGCRGDLGAKRACKYTHRWNIQGLGGMQWWHECVERARSKETGRQKQVSAKRKWLREIIRIAEGLFYFPISHTHVSETNRSLLTEGDVHTQPGPFILHKIIQQNWLEKWKWLDLDVVKTKSQCR